MSMLFPVDPPFPAGFSYVPEFIDRQEEEILLRGIADVELHSFLFQGYEAKRRTASFGYDYSFEKRSLAKGKEIPQMFDWLIEKVAHHTRIEKADFAELLVTEYPVEAVINWHRDAPPFDIIAGISLSSDCMFRLRPHEKEKRTRKSIISFPVQRRSLYIISGEARTEWQHSTLPAKSVRHSITLRTLKKKPG